MEIEPLTQEGFRPFGDVISVAGRPFRTVNYGYADRFEHLAQLDVIDGGTPSISIFRARPVAFPFAVERLERHPSSSQAFLPGGDSRFLIIVAPASEAPELEQLRFFVTDGSQGVNYRRGVWHHFLLTLDQGQYYFVIDRSNPDENTVEFELNSPIVIESAGSGPCRASQAVQDT